MPYAALAVSFMALFFTVGSFWWLHARPGKLRTYEPTTWASYLGRDRSALRLPLVLHNTGAAALVVIGLRVRFVEGGELMPWEWTRTRVDPKGNDVQDVTAPFSIAGGGTHELVAEFVGNYPGVVPDQRAHPVVIQARSSLSNDWQMVLSFDLQLGNLIHPANYIVYTNQDLQLRARDKLGEVDDRIADLQSIRETLFATLDAGCEDAVECAGTECCPIP